MEGITEKRRETGGTPYDHQLMAIEPMALTSAFITPGIARPPYGTPSGTQRSGVNSHRPGRRRGTGAQFSTLAGPPIPVEHSGHRNPAGDSRNQKGDETNEQPGSR
ncbi:hypothetical protein [Streptacidiphilus sp. EB129]|uniref:hypothetical protein n=1 Tax=Streptacidiphilus sp. EB129 TaxID=3156262 RepID=UPI00351438A0